MTSKVMVIFANERQNKYNKHLLVQEKKRSPTADFSPKQLLSWESIVIDLVGENFLNVLSRRSLLGHFPLCTLASHSKLSLFFIPHYSLWPVPKKMLARMLSQCSGFINSLCFWQMTRIFISGCMIAWKMWLAPNILVYCLFCAPSNQRQRFYLNISFSLSVTPFFSPMLFSSI